MRRLLHLALFPSAILASFYADAVLGEPDGCKSCMNVDTMGQEDPSDG